MIQLSPLVTSFSPCNSISTSTVQEKWLYSRKVFLRILCVIRGVDCYIYVNSFFVVFSTFTRVYPVLQPFFNRRLELSVEQDCLLWGPRVIKPTRFWKSCTQVTHALYGRRKGVLFTYGGRTLIRKLNKLCEAAAAVNKLENHL